MQDLNVALLETDLFWEDPERNLKMFSDRIGTISGAADLIILPEMFTTGFALKKAPVLAESMDGKAVQWMRQTAASKGCVVAGSVMIKENGKFFNRLIWMPPDGLCSFYDKKNLFSFAEEDQFFEPGKDRRIVTLKGWKFLLTICYDLRFPEWCRNRHDSEKGFDYDCMINVANWPEERSHAWRVLLMSRAIENQSFVAGVNRIGSDGNGLRYSGGSALIDPCGEPLSAGGIFKEGSETLLTMKRDSLDSWRDAFRSWADWKGRT